MDRGNNLCNAYEIPLTFKLRLSEQRFQEKLLLGPGERRWRRLSVVIGGSGTQNTTLHNPLFPFPFRFDVRRRKTKRARSDCCVKCYNCKKKIKKIHTYIYYVLILKAGFVRCVLSIFLFGLNVLNKFPPQRLLTTSKRGNLISYNDMLHATIYTTAGYRLPDFIFENILSKVKCGFEITPAKNDSHLI